MWQTSKTSTAVFETLWFPIIVAAKNMVKATFCHVWLENLGCGAGVVWRRRFFGVVGDRFLTTPGVRVRFFCPTPDVQLDHFLHHIPKIHVEMVQYLLKLLLKQSFLAVRHDFHWFYQPNFILFYVKESESEIWKGRSRKFWKGRSWSRIFFLRLRKPVENIGICKLRIATMLGTFS